MKSGSGRNILGLGGTETSVCLSV